MYYVRIIKALRRINLKANDESVKNLEITERILSVEKKINELDVFVYKCLKHDFFHLISSISF